jgi:hypothetical protein
MIGSAASPLDKGSITPIATGATYFSSLQVDESVQAWSHEVPYVVGRHRRKWSDTNDLIPKGGNADSDVLMSVPKSAHPTLDAGFSRNDQDPFLITRQQLIYSVLELIQSEADYLTDLKAFRNVCVSLKC